MESYSKIVSDGMKRACSAITKIVHPLGFRRGNGRKWIRNRNGIEDLIYVTRSGATYGAPYSASISLRIDLRATRESDGTSRHLHNHESGMIRRDTGYCYHHRFNAETGSTYERCVEELGLFMIEVAEPWFAEQHRALETP